MKGTYQMLHSERYAGQSISFKDEQVEFDLEGKAKASKDAEKHLGGLKHIELVETKEAPKKASDVSKEAPKKAPAKRATKTATPKKEG